jgi:hypothetical protein
MNTNCEKNTCLVNPLVMMDVQLKESNMLPQGELACGSQAFTTTLLFDPSVSVLPLIEMQKSQSVGLFPANRERELGVDRREAGQFYLTDKVDIAAIIEVSTRGRLPSGPRQMWLAGKIIP